MFSHTQSFLLLIVGRGVQEIQHHFIIDLNHVALDFEDSVPSGTSFPVIDRLKQLLTESRNNSCTMWYPAHFHMQHDKVHKDMNYLAASLNVSLVSAGRVHAE